MAITNTQIAERLLKISQGVSETNFPLADRGILEEAYGTYNIVEPSNIWSNNILSTPPSGMSATTDEWGNNCEELGDYRKYDKLQLTAVDVAGQEYSYKSVNGELVDAISGRFGFDYNFHIYDGTTEAEIFTGDWLVDPAAGILIFYNITGVTEGTVSRANPPKITFYKYIGGKGFSLTLSGLTDTNLNNILSGDTLFYSNGMWINTPIITSLSALTDTNLNNIISGETLVYNNGIWINSSLTATYLQNGYSYFLDNVSGVQNITFPNTLGSDLSGKSYSLSILVWNDTGDIGYSVSNRTNTGFYITPDETANIEIIALLNGTTVYNPYSISLSGLSDTSVDSVVSGETLVYSNGLWVNSSITFTIDAIYEDIKNAKNIIRVNPDFGDDVKALESRLIPFKTPISAITYADTGETVVFEEGDYYYLNSSENWAKADIKYHFMPGSTIHKTVAGGVVFDFSTSSNVTDIIFTGHLKLYAKSGYGYSVNQSSNFGLNFSNAALEKVYIEFDEVICHTGGISISDINNHNLNVYVKGNLIGYNVDNAAIQFADGGIFYFNIQKIVVDENNTWAGTTGLGVYDSDTRMILKGYINELVVKNSTALLNYGIDIAYADTTPDIDKTVEINVNKLEVDSVTDAVCYGIRAVSNEFVSKININLANVKNNGRLLNCEGTASYSPGIQLNIDEVNSENLLFRTSFFSDMYIEINTNKAIQNSSVATYMFQVLGGNLTDNLKITGNYTNLNGGGVFLSTYQGYVDINANISVSQDYCVFQNSNCVLKLNGSFENSGASYDDHCIIKNNGTLYIENSELLTSDSNNIFPLYSPLSQEDIYIYGNVNTNYTYDLLENKYLKNKYTVSGVTGTSITINGETFTENDTATYSTEALLAGRMVDLINLTATGVTASQTLSADTYFYVESTVFDFTASTLVNLTEENIVNSSYGFNYLNDKKSIFYGDGSNLTGIVTTLTGLTDVSLTNVTNGQSLIYSSGVWVNSSITATLEIDGFITLLTGATIGWDLSSSTNVIVTLTTGNTLSISGMSNGSYGTIIVKQDAIGNHSLTLPLNSKVAGGGGGSVSLTPTPNAEDILSFIYDGSNFYWNATYDYN